MNFKYLTAFLVLFFSIFLFNINNSEALKELNISTPDLARSSTDIVIAKCISSEARVDEKTGLIFTYTTFEIDESLKGKYGDELILRIVGGTVGDRTVSSPFLPLFEDNEEVVLFLGPKNTDGYPVLKSLNKGIIRVSTESSGSKIVSSSVSDLPLYNSRTDQRLQNANKINLDDFIYSIQNVL